MSGARKYRRPQPKSSSSSSPSSDDDSDQSDVLLNVPKSKGPMRSKRVGPGQRTSRPKMSPEEAEKMMEAFLATFTSANGGSKDAEKH